MKKNEVMGDDGAWKEFGEPSDKAPYISGYDIMSHY